MSRGASVALGRRWRYFVLRALMCLARLSTIPARTSSMPSSMAGLGPTVDGSGRGCGPAARGSLRRMTTGNENPGSTQLPPNPRAGGRRIADPALTPERRQLIERAAAALPDDASDTDIAAQAIRMAKDERGTSWVELVDDGWIVDAADVRTVLGRP